MLSIHHGEAGLSFFSSREVAAACFMKVSPLLLVIKKSCLLGSPKVCPQLTDCTHPHKTVL